MRGLTRRGRTGDRRAAVAGLLLLGNTLLGGCYTFAPVAPVAPAALPAGTHVRVGLTEAGAAALAPVIGSSVDALEGSVVRQHGDTLVVRARTLQTTAGVDVTWTGGDLAVPAPWRRTVDRRRLAVGRTALLAGGGAVLAAGIMALVRGLGDQQGDPGGGGGPPPHLSRGGR